MVWFCHPGAWENWLWAGWELHWVEKAIAAQRPCTPSHQHGDKVMRKKKGKVMHFPHMELSCSLGSSACTKFWDMSKCQTTQHKTNHQPESRKGWGEERWAPISIQDWSWPGLDSDISQISFGKSPRATAPSGVSDLAKCRLRTSPHRLV